jgi:hypothetical protein
VCSVEETDRNGKMARLNFAQEGRSEERAALLRGPEPEQPSRGKPLIPSRYVLALLALFGFFNVYAMRVNLSIAIVKMADQYNWSPSTKGMFWNLNNVLNDLDT